jgi:hypothetical protein
LLFFTDDREKLFGNSERRPYWHLHESTRSAKTPVLPLRVGEKYSPDVTLTIFQTVSEVAFSEVREQEDLLKPFLMSTIKEGTTLREAP